MQQNDIFNVNDAEDKCVILDKRHPPPVTPAKTPECVVVQVRIVTIEKAEENILGNTIEIVFLVRCRNHRRRLR